MAANSGRGQQFGGVSIHIALQPQELVETFHSTDDTRLRPWLDAYVLQGADKALQVIGCGMLDSYTCASEVTREFVHIVAVGLGRVGAHSLLHGQEPQETPFHIRYVSNITQKGIF
jgi:hypothetical protein